jgi:hypothetical protein
MARASISVFAALALGLPAFATSLPVCPNPPVARVDSALLPEDVCIPAGFTELTVDFFDDYSWRALVALISPGTAPGPAPGPKKFETFHPRWEVFHRDGSAPGVAPQNNACSAKFSAGDLVLASFPGLPDDIGQTSDGSLVGPLVAQNGRYVRYLTAYNDVAYRHIADNKWYLRSSLPEVPVPRPPTPPVQFPNGSIVVKSAWIDMEGFSGDQRARYYTRIATVRDPETGACEGRLVGLAGLHIVQKTPSRPQWIWTSFEQVDNVPAPGAHGAGKYALHDGTDEPMPLTNPFSLTPLAKQPVKPFNVVRSEKAPIHPKTAETNAKYRKLLAGSVWQNYQLVMTQWPLQPGDQSLPVPASHAGDVFQTFPGEGATSAFANMTMETFNQSRPAQGCMSCHNRARLGADFMWSVMMHAWPEKK